jgi:integrase
MSKAWQSHAVKPYAKRAESDQVWPRVRPWKYANGTPGWCCDARGKNGGKRTYHASEDAANAQAQVERIAQLNKPDFTLDGRAQLDAGDAYELLQKERPGLNLLDAVRGYLKMMPVTAGKKTVAETIDECLADMTGKGLKSRSIRDFKTKVKNGFGSVFGARQISEVAQYEIKSWLRGLKVKPITANGYRSNVHILFSFAKGEKYVLENPVTDIEPVAVDSERPGILSVDQVKALLAAAARLTPDIVPMLALNVFAGLRPEAETFRSSWQCIDMEAGEIDIEGYRSKNSMSDRDFKLEPNLIAWLKPYAKSEGELGPKNEAYYDRLRLCRKEAGIAEWPQDVLRHTFASMHFKYFGNAHDTAAKLGHGQSLTMFIRKYRNKKITPKDAAAFWQIYPQQM